MAEPRFRPRPPDESSPSESEAADLHAEGEPALSVSYVAPDVLSTPLAEVFGRYDEALLRKVAQKLIRPRNQWPVPELVQRLVAALANPPAIDRRLKEITPEARQLLCMVGRSGRCSWSVGNLVEMLMMTGKEGDIAPIMELLESGLLVPSGMRNSPKLKSFEHWLAAGGPRSVESPTTVTARTLDEPLGLPDVPTEEIPNAPALASDGLEWFLRLAVLAQQVEKNPLRRTMQGDFYKRDADRLLQDSILASQPADGLTAIPGPGLFTVALALAVGLLREHDSELTLASEGWRIFGASAAGARTLLAGLPEVRGWNPVNGEREEGHANPWASLNLFALLCLGRLAPSQWASPDDLNVALAGVHPFWKERPAAQTGLRTFLLGIAHPMRLVEAAKNEAGQWRVRLSSTGRWALGYSSVEPEAPNYPQTLLVQPNLEILAFRQGLTPDLIANISRFARWKSLGPACTLQLEAESVYHGLEAGASADVVLQTLSRNSMKPVPQPVIDSIRTWSNKRDRISVYSSAALFEFASPAEMQEALSRGLAATPLTDRLAVVLSESQADFRNFRLTGTRDYCLPPEACVEASDDGVTLSIDTQRSDLILETEIGRFAEPMPDTPAPTRRVYRLTPASVAKAREGGMSQEMLERWFQQRTGGPASSASLLLWRGKETSDCEIVRPIVVNVPTEAVADGLVQWPGTRSLFQARLGPTALVIAEENLDRLTERLAELGISLKSCVVSFES